MATNLELQDNFLMGKITPYEFLTDLGIQAASYDFKPAKEYAKKKMKELGILVTGSETLAWEDRMVATYIINDLKK